MKVVPVSLNVIQKISQVRLYFSNDLRPVERRLSVLRSIEEVVKRFPDGVPLLDPVQDMKINEKGFQSVIKSIAQFEQRLKKNPIHNSPDAQLLYEMYERKAQLFNKVQEAKQELKEAKSLLQMDELKCRKRVLRRLGYSAEGDVIQLKGRVACELSSADELLLTEMIFNGTFVDLEPEKAAALLSCLVCDERSNDAPKLTEDLSGALKNMQEMARQIAKVSIDCKLDIEEDAYVEQFKPYLMDVVHEWCRGASFSKLCEMTEVFEGGIIRCMRRLEELLRQMSLAAKVIGNKELEDKFNDAVRLLKRDIVFAASLYL
jgi:ATP-dependent RNA helicase DOB1